MPSLKPLVQQLLPTLLVSKKSEQFQGIERKEVFSKTQKIATELENETDISITNKKDRF